MKNTSIIFVFWVSIFLFFAFSLFVVIDTSVGSFTEKSLGESMSASLLSNTAPEQYVVSRVVDGDTIEVEKEGVKEKVRLIGINAPESVDPRKTVECFGKESSDELKTLLKGQQVKLYEDNTQDNRDKYGRLLRYVYTDDHFINLVMIERGYAYEHTYKAPYVHQVDFRNAQKAAIEKAEGLWASATCAGRK